jgi:endo-1,4-beta-xylanase
MLRPENAATLLTDHVGRMVRRFRGTIAYWDVLNEIMNVRDGRPDGLRLSAWLRNCGTSYIEVALQTARRTDPSAKLGYNEWGLEDDSEAADVKRLAVLALLRRLRREHVPIDYLGVQGHLMGTQTFSDGKLGAFLRAVEDLGIGIAVTELDVDDRAFPPATAARDRAVAGTYARFLDVVLRHSAPLMVTVWGLSDRSSFPQATRPRRDGLLQRSLPFDAALRPKEAWRILEARGLRRKRGDS